jgi:hypothetical protein
MGQLRGFGKKLMHVSLASIVQKLSQAARTPEVDFLAQIPVVALSEIVGQPVIRVIGSYSYVDGSLPWRDTLALLSVLVDRSPRSVLEIGTFDGHTTRLMAINLPDAEIHTIDLPEDFSDINAGMPKDDWHLISSRRVGSQYRSDPSIKSVRQHFGDTATYDFPAVEIFFIDGAHTYSYVRNDTEKALRSPGVKTLIWHDSDQLHREVTQWLVEMIHSGYHVRQIEGTNLAILEVDNTVGTANPVNLADRAPLKFDIEFAPNRLNNR